MVNGDVEKYGKKSIIIIIRDMIITTYVPKKGPWAVRRSVFSVIETYPGNGGYQLCTRFQK